MSRALSFLPAVASPIILPVASLNVKKFPSVNFFDFLDAFPSLRDEFSVPYDTQSGTLYYKKGIDFFKDKLCLFTQFYFYEYFIEFFRENADVSLCEADILKSRIYPIQSRNWLVDVYTGDIHFIPESALNGREELDMKFAFCRYSDTFYIRKSSVMYDDLNRCDDFIYNLRAVYDEDGVCYYVPSSVSDEGLICEHCGKFVLSSDDAHIIANDGTVFCSSNCAIESEYGCCAKCGRWESVYDMTYIENAGEIYCDRCVERYVFQCSNCLNFFDFSDTTENVTAEDGTHFCCAECAANSGYYQCDDCGRWFSEDSVRYSDISDRYLCDDCFSEEKSDAARVIHEYGYKPRYNFNCTPEERDGKNLYFGVEIETEYNDEGDFYSSIMNLDSISSETEEMIYLKHDSSLSSEGVEIVTMPCTLDYLKSEEGKSIFKRVFSELSTALPSSDAGTHVHISRAGFTESMSVCLELFFMRNAVLCQKICGRGSVYYAAYDTEREVTDLKRFSPSYIDDRYRCINWNNSRTVEIRAFSAITTIEQFYKNVEFCHAVYQYIKKNADNLEFFQYGDIEGDFLQYVKSNADRYNHLSAFINELF